MNKTANTKEIKMNIINLVTTINDMNKLKLIYRQAEKLKDMPDEQEVEESKLNINDSTVEIEEGVSFQDILDEQNYKPTSYQEFRKLADQIEWEHSLEELLATLD